jgi:hypothetical protein
MAGDDSLRAEMTPTPSQARPTGTVTFLAIDDAVSGFWVDTPSLRWLVFLARRLEGVPLLVVLATRPPEQAVDRGLVTSSSPSRTRS